MRDPWLMGAVAAQDQYNPEEGHFQTGIRATPWFSEFKQKYGEEPNLNDPDYDYRAAWRAGARPDVVIPVTSCCTGPASLRGQTTPTALSMESIRVEVTMLASTEACRD